MSLVKHVLDIKGHKVYAIDPGALVFDALRMMADNNVSSLVVLEDEKLVGIITERVYARETCAHQRPGHNPQECCFAATGSCSAAV
jgi:signal-transduction protein with cAMP-binding, CBS, and nucleotidyltransferase domain